MGSDDGGYLRMASVEFTATFNESGPAIAGDGEIIFDGTRGHGWTTGQFTVPDGDPLRTQFEVLFFERGGGDSLEVAILDDLDDSGNDAGTIAADFTVLRDGALGWSLVEITQGDFNFDGTIDLGDFLILSSNFGTGDLFEQGDLDFSGRVDLADFVAFRDIFAAQGQAQAAAVPEPSTFALFGLAALGLAARRRRAR